MKSETLSAEEVRALLDYNPDTGKFRWKHARRGIKAGQIAGHVNARGYESITVNLQRNYSHRLAWLVMTGSWPSNQIDHINCNKSDNRFENLREADDRQNHGNVSMYSNNTSGIKGVGWVASRQKWEAYITISRKKKNLGRFTSKDAAHEAYRNAAKLHFGEFARTSK